MADTAETITVEGMEIRFLVEGKDSAGMLAVSEFGVPAGLAWTVGGEETELLEQGLTPHPAPPA